ncbi:MAG: PLP-dependent transferase [Phycisphaerales bacterium]|nr:PLP-dependent transferase [Phycisphaerales bacterium]
MAGDTTAIHGGLSPDPQTGALVQPLVQSTTFVNEAVGVSKGYAYSRVSTPPISALEAQLRALEGAAPRLLRHGPRRRESPSSSSLLKAGDHVVLGDALYGGTVRLVEQVLSGLASEGAPSWTPPTPKTSARPSAPTPSSSSSRARPTPR